MKWNLNKASGICWSKLKHICGQLERLEGRNIPCMRCLVVSDFLADPCDIKLDHMADGSLEEYMAFLLRVNALSKQERGI